MVSAAQKLGALKQLAVQSQPRDDHGRFASKSGAVSGLSKLQALAQNHPGVVRSALAGAGKAVGGAIGGAVAGHGGAMAGSLIGGLATRQVIATVEAAHTAQHKLEHDEAFQRAKGLEKLKQLGAATLSELKEQHMQEALTDARVGDIAGWAIGTAVTHAVNHAIESATMIPGKGAVAAAVSVPHVVKLGRKLRGSG